MLKTVRLTCTIFVVLTALAFVCLRSRHLSPAVSAASTFTVTNTNDSGPGSLRQAILDANANPGTDSITFSIGSGLQTIVPTSRLPDITDPVVIDGTTQPGFAGNPIIEVSGTNAPSFPNVGLLTITGGNTTIRGLILNRAKDFTLSIVTLGGNHIEGNYIGTDATGNASTNSTGNLIAINNSPNNTIGGTAPGTRNVISGSSFHGISIFGLGATGNVIQGNYIGLNAAGNSRLGTFFGIFLGSSNNIVGGTVPSARNIISANDSGIVMQVNGTFGNVIQGNYIGTDATGTINLGNTNNGIAIFGSSNNTIGGSIPEAGNVISGNATGIEINGDGSIIQGNYIGVGADGVSPLGNRIRGIRIGNANNTTIGGASPQAANVVAFNGADAAAQLGIGIDVLGGTGNSIAGNSIFSNVRLGIDLATDGVTANDAGDPDSGANNRQNFPVITSVVADPGQTTITGSLNSSPSTTFQINFFANGACDSSGNGEGAIPFGATSVSTDASGNAPFSVVIPTLLLDGRVITATATDPAGNTSEFSACDVSKAAGYAQISSPAIQVIEDVGFVTINVVRSNGTHGTLAVDYLTRNVTAMAGQDYVATSGTLVFNDGETTKSFDVPITDDNIAESNETFLVQLRPGSNIDSVGPINEEVITLQDHDVLPVLTVNSVSVTEPDAGTTAAVLTVTLSPMTGRTVTVNYATADGGFATSGVDYQPTSGMLTFGPRVTSQQISVLVIGDQIDEFTEQFDVELGGASGATIGGVGIVSILDNDPPPSISISDASAAEGNSGTTVLQFPVNLSAPSGKLVSANFATSDGTATSGSDYVATSGTIFFGAGEMSKTISVTVNGDTTIEPNESFSLTLTNPLNATITRSQATGTIINDDSAAIQFSSASYSVNESSPFVTITVNRAGDLAMPSSARYATSDTAGLADCGVFASKASERCDYVTSVGTVAFGAGESVKTFVVPIVDDVHVEGNETFAVTLSNAVGVPVGSPATATVTIVDNDSTPATQNPIDGVDFFVRQQYLDILGRQPDQTGLQNWVNTLSGCPNGGFGEPPTSDCDRLHVAAGFFQSDEFLNRGYWAFRFYMIAFNQRPTYAQFIPDMSQVGGPKSPAEEESSKVAFADAFVQRPEFLSKYGSATSGQALADALTQNAGLPAFTVTGGMTNGQILRAIAERQTSLDKFLTEGTVSILYFGFQRRDPDTIGYQNNVNTLNADPNNLRHLIFIFIYSTEYRGRFGPP